MAEDIRISVRLTQEENKKLEEMAKADRRNKSNFVQVLINQAWEKYQEENNSK